MKKKIFFIFTAVVLVFSMVLAGCSSDDPKEPDTTPTKAPSSASATANKTSTPKAENTSSPAPTESDSTKAPVVKNLMDGAISEDLIKMSWEVEEGMWTGPYPVPPHIDSPAKYIEEQDVNGETKDCLVVTYPTDTNQASYGCGTNVGNVYGIGDVIEKNTTYKFTVTLKYTDPTKAGEAGHEELMCITSNAAKENVTSANNTGSIVKFTASDDWQTLEYIFTTGDEMPSKNDDNEHDEPPYIMVGPSCDFQRPYGSTSVGMTLVIADVSLVEYTPS